VYDGQGNIPSGTFTVNTTTTNGGSFQGTFTGTCTVNGDCTGTLQIDLGDGTLFHFALVVQGSARHTAINTDSGTLMSVFSIQKIGGEKDTAETR
jgi:autotransporter adhesin